MIDAVRDVIRRLLRTGPRSGRGAGGETPHPVGWSSMGVLLDDLAEVAADHPELLDTDVRERMWDVVEQQLIRQAGDVQVPHDLGMFSTEANARLQVVLQENLIRLREVFNVFDLDNEAKRLASFHNPKVTSSGGRYHVDDFFGSP